jgi:hypothetical protein
MEPHDYATEHFERMSQLSRALKKLPAQVLEHRYLGDTFGSWYVVIRHSGRVSELSYDGRDDYLALRRSPDRKPPYSYGPQEPVGAGTGLGSLNGAAIEEVCRAVTS